MGRCHVKFYADENEIKFLQWHALYEGPKSHEIFKTHNFENCFMKLFLEKYLIDTIHWTHSLPHCLVFPFLSKLNIVITFKKLCFMCKRAITFSATCLCLILSLVSTVLKIWKLNFILQVSNHSTCSFLFVCFFLFLSHVMQKRLHMHYPFKRMEWQCQSPDRKNKWNK